MSNQNTAQFDSFLQGKYTLVDLGRAKTRFFKKIGNHCLGTRHLKRQCGASLNTPRELAREKKVDMGDNLSPKHSANR